MRRLMHIGAVMMQRAAAAMLGLALAASVQAETFDSTIADTRMLAAFKVDETALQTWLPETHRPAPYAAGAFEGANLVMMFIDRMLHQDADGEPKNGGSYRMMALIVPATEIDTGEKTTFIARVYTPGDGAGPYKTALKADVSHALSLKGTGTEPLSGRHRWRIAKDGGAIDISVAFTAEVPGRKTGESLLSSPADPDVARIYRYDQLTDVVLSIPKDIDRTSEVSVTVTIPELAEMFDGTETLIGLADRPFYTRQTFKP
ncbi:MAG: hypothetical protein AAGE13_02615 [Pseudomonadota bacterium]